jgi:hypothetical protein
MHKLFVILDIVFILIVAALLDVSRSNAKADPLDDWEWRLPEPTGDDLYAVIFANNLFVAVGSNGTLITSVDALTWTHQQSNTKEPILEIAYGNGMFVALTPGGTLSSSDGKHWVWQPMGGTSELKNVIYCLGSFFLFADDMEKTVIFRSSTGIAWHDSPTIVLPEHMKDINVTFGNGILIALSSEGGLWTSLDGATWLKQDSISVQSPLRGFAFGGGSFVAIGGGDASFALSSRDGKKWSENDNIPINWTSTLSYANGFFFATSTGRMWGSPDGITWAEHEMPPGQTLTDLAYGNNRFVAVGFQGTILISEDRFDWSPMWTPTLPQPSTGISYGNGIFVATGSGLDGEPKLILTSSDLTSWTPQLDVPTQGNSPLKVRFVNGVFIVSGGDGLLTSPDGFSWRKRSTNWDPSATAYGNGIFIAVSGFAVSTSADGITWTIPQTKGMPGDEVTSLSFGNGIFVASGYGAIWSSTNGLAWTERLNVDVGSIVVSYGNNTFVAIGSSSVFTSLDGIKWTLQETSVTPGSSDLIYAYGTFVALDNLWGVGLSGTIYTSPDGITWKQRLTVRANLKFLTFAEGRFVTLANGAILQSALVGPRLHIFSASPNSIRLKILGEPDRSYSVEASTDLMSWTRLDMPTNLFGNVEFVDTTATNLSHRFYRATAP